MRRIIEKLTYQDIADIDKRQWDQEYRNQSTISSIRSQKNGAYYIRKIGAKPEAKRVMYQASGKITLFCG